MDTNINKLLETAQQKLLKNELEDAMFILLNAANTWVPRVLDLMNECKIRRDTLLESDSEKRTVGDGQEYHDQTEKVGNEETGKTGNGADSELYALYKNKDIIFIRGENIKGIETTAIDKTYQIVFNTEFIQQLKLAEQALAAGNIEDAGKIIALANDICRTDKVLNLKKANQSHSTVKHLEAPKNMKYKPRDFEKPADPEASVIDEYNAKSCITIALKAFDCKNYEKAQKYVLKAKCFDPNVKIQGMLVDLEEILSYKKEAVIKYAKMADEAIERNNFKEAEGILLDALATDPTADIKDMLEKVRVNMENTRKAVRHLRDLIKVEENNNNYLEVLKYLLEIRKADPSEPVDNDIENVKGKIKHNQEIAKGMLKSTNLLIKEGNFAEAEKMFLKIQDLKINIDVQDELLYVQNSLVSQNCSTDEQRIKLIECTNKAQNAQEEGKLDFALSLYEKAQSMYEKLHKQPSSKIAEVIDRIKLDAEELKKMDHLLKINEAESNKYVQAALKALNSRKYEKAEHLLEEAKHIHSTKYIEELMKIVHMEKQNALETDETENDKEEKPEAATSTTIEKFIQCATNEINRKRHYAAQSWLKLANGILVTEAGKQLVKNVEESLQSLAKRFHKEQEKFRKSQARYYIDKARNCLNEGNLEEATISVIISQNIYYSDGTAHDLIEDIFAKKFKIGQTRKKEFVTINSDSEEQFSTFLADCYKEAAVTALKMKDPTLAEDYLERSHAYHFCVDNIILLRQVRKTVVKKPIQIVSEHFVDFPALPN